MRRGAALAGALALPLAVGACGSSVELTNATIAEVAHATASIPRPEPGEWTTDAQLTAFDAGADRSPMAAAMKARVGDTDTTEACLTDEEARKPLFGDLSPTAGANCTFRRFAYREGRLDATMVCENAGRTLTVSQRGSYSANAVDLVSTTAVKGADGKPVGSQTTRVTAKRTGDCGG